MNNQNLNEGDSEEIIDLEAYVLADKIPPHGKKYKVKIDNKYYVFHHHIVTGKEVLERADKIPVECHSLYLKLRHKDFELVRPHEEVDLIQKRIEHFVTKPPVVFHYFIDKESATTEETELTPNQILELAGITPVSDYYLVKVNTDGSQISYKDSPNVSIKMVCPAVKFVSVFRGETPVSKNDA